MKRGFNRPEDLRAVNMAVYDYIKAYQDEHGYPPSRRDIAAHIGGVASSAQQAVNRLVDEGLITVTPGIPRGIRVTGAAMKAVTEKV